MTRNVHDAFVAPVSDIIPPAEAVVVRAMVWKLFTRIQANFKDAEKRLDTLQKSRPMAGFGCYDEKEYDRTYAKHMQAEESAGAQYDTWKAAWNIVKDVVGVQTADHAIEEGQQRIGDLPYVKEEL